MRVVVAARLGAEGGEEGLAEGGVVEEAVDVAAADEAVGGAAPSVMPLSKRIMGRAVARPVEMPRCIS